MLHLMKNISSYTEGRFLYSGQTLNMELAKGGWDGINMKTKGLIQEKKAPTQKMKT